MNLENAVKDVIAQKMNDGTVEKLIVEQLENGIEKALSSLFGSYGDATKLIEDQIKSVMVPFLENYDYSQYITKLDSVLVEVLQNTTAEHSALLENFKGLMEQSKDKEIKASALFDIWKDYVAANVETDGLEVNYDDDISYDHVEVTFEFEEDESRSWSVFSHALMIFECEHDENMNFSVPVSRYKNDPENTWKIEYKRSPDLKSLKYLSNFEIQLMNLTQNGAILNMDLSFHEMEEVLPDAEPEASFS
ncbi:hypothetical protein KP77_25400 [Jeotgalibacillus alimentarius]|uniref:Uncharacterized protein n=1 Tax=Jeotgalibacillus alimentarius TaxID=135826 RepID=A0A0C2VRA1_9BACL|nr:hypothetical protein [Jeotgalibacillus alimentarius]KIL46971.1 hypothetical protein KP77_25400 [Jeotgalibacillus alimentarius]